MRAQARDGLAVRRLRHELGAARASYYPELDRVRIPALAVDNYGARDARGQREADGHAVHEMVHALQDLTRWSLQLWEVEGTAYVAQMIYLHVRRLAEDPGCPVEHDLRNPIRVDLARTAHAIAGASGSLRAPGRLVALSEAMLSPIIKPLQRVPGLASRVRQPVAGHNGVLGAQSCSCQGLPR